MDKKRCWYCNIEMDKELLAKHMYICVAEMVRYR